MDDYYDYGSWDYGGDMPGDSSSLMYGSDVDPSAYSDTYGGDVGAWGNVDQPMDWGQSSSGSAPFNPEEYLAQQGGYSAPGEQGMFDKLGSTFMDKLRANPAQVLSSLGTFGTSLYSAIEGNKQRNAMAKQIQDAKSAREAKLAKYGAVLPMKLQRTMLQPQGDLLTAGQRSGGLNWFTPAQYVPMADGGSVEPSWLARIKTALSSHSPDPSVVGAGTAARAGDAIMQNQYQRYAVGQQMDGTNPLPYEVWVQMKQQGRGYAEGGHVRGWLDRIGEALASRQPSPAVVGAGTAAQAGDVMLKSQYQRYAVGQQMEGLEPLPFEVWVQMKQQGKGMARGGLSSLVGGEGGGQEDNIHIQASPGEYMFSAQDVSDLGDGNNAEGAAKLDAMRKNLRTHKKRSKDLAPKAKTPEAYLRGRKL